MVPQESLTGSKSLKGFKFQAAASNRFLPSNTQDHDMHRSVDQDSLQSTPEVKYHDFFPSYSYTYLVLMANLTCTWMVVPTMLWGSGRSKLWQRLDGQLAEANQTSSGGALQTLRSSSRASSLVSAHVYLGKVFFGIIGLNVITCNYLIV